MLFKVATFFIRRLLVPVFFGMVSCVLLAALFTIFSEELYDLIPIITKMIFCPGVFISSKISTHGIKHSRMLLGLFCSFTFLIISSLVSSLIFRNFSFSNFLIKFVLAIIFGLLGSFKFRNSKKYVKGHDKNKSRYC